MGDQTGAAFSSTGSPCSSAWPVNVRVSGAGMPLVLYSARSPPSAPSGDRQARPYQASNPGLSEEPVRAPLLLVNVMLYLFRQHLDLGVVEFRTRSARE